MGEPGSDRVGAVKVAGNLSPKLEWPLANPKWAATLNPILANPVVNGNLLPSMRVVTGLNVINHKLGRKLQGYMVVLNNTAVTFYDGQDINQYPDMTLALYASGAATISLYVF